MDEYSPFGSLVPPRSKSLADLLTSETIVQRPPSNEATVRALLGDRSVMNQITPIGQDQSMSPMSMAMGLIGCPAGRGAGNAFGRVSDLRRQFGVQGRDTAQQAYDASRAETQRVLGVIDDALGPGPRPAPVVPAPSTDEVLEAIRRALAIRGQ